MTLICTLLGHKANAAKVRWNGGICFGACARCGCDMVRSGTGSWRVPRGFRVVWRAVPQAVDGDPPQGEGRQEPDTAEPLDQEQLREPVPAALEDTVTFRDEEPLEEFHAAQETVAEDGVRSERTEPFEWPLVSQPALATDTYADPIAEIAVIARKPELEETRFPIDDFMDEQNDDLDWGDLRVRH